MSLSDAERAAVEWLDQGTYRTWEEWKLGMATLRDGLLRREELLDEVMNALEVAREAWIPGYSHQAMLADIRSVIRNIQHASEQHNRKVT